jgi:hypothetical protein
LGAEAKGMTCFQLAAVIAGGVQVVLVIQKLVHFIAWPWWKVLSPLWLTCAVVVAAGMYGVFK